MKLTLVLLALTLSAGVQAHADTALRVPLFVSGIVAPATGSSDAVITPVSEVNKELVAKGLAPLPDVLEFKAGAATQPQAFEIGEANAVALQAAGYPNAQAEGEQTPGSNNSGDVKTCFTGDALGVPALVQSLGDLVYSDQYALQGWKYQTTAFYVDDAAETRKFLNAEVQWRTYNKKSDAVMMSASIGDDGTDVQISLIPRCK
jgi:hypothetical protein